MYSQDDCDGLCCSSSNYSLYFDSTNSIDDYVEIPSNSSLPSDERERLQELGLYKINV